MSEKTDKKFKQTFNRKLKKQLQETAEKLINDKIRKQLENNKKEIFHIARQRDWMLLLNIFLGCVIIVLGVLLWMKI